MYPIEPQTSVLYHPLIEPYISIVVTDLTEQIIAPLGVALTFEGGAKTIAAPVGEVTRVGFCATG
jgi:hypothetical protein